MSTVHTVTKSYILYDGRAEGGSTDDAAVLEAISADELRHSLMFWHGHDGVLAEYDLKGNVLTNERIVGHLREGTKALLAKVSR